MRLTRIAVALSMVLSFAGMAMAANTVDPLLKFRKCIAEYAACRGAANNDFKKKERICLRKFPAKGADYAECHDAAQHQREEDIINCTFQNCDFIN